MPTLTSAHMHLICACKPKRPASTGDGNLMANGVAGLRSDLTVAMDLEMDPVHRQQETCMYRSGDMPGRYARERCSGDIHGDAHDDAHGHAHSEAHMTTHMTMHMTILSSTSLRPSVRLWSMADMGWRSRHGLVVQAWGGSPRMVVQA